MMSQCTVLVLSVLTLVLIFLLPYADCLLCYQCGTTAEAHECISDNAGFVNTSRGLTNKYEKNCTAANVNWTRCMILTVHGQAGVQALFHRGCHDGVTFSKLYEHHRFVGLPANNQTTCARITASREFVCFTFCETDFCNGPQAPPFDPAPKNLNKTCTNTNANDTSEFDCEPNGLTKVHGTISLTLLGVLCTFVSCLASYFNL